MEMILCGDCIEKMQEFDDNSIDALVSDPPYGLAFMNKEWDDFKPHAFQEFSFQWGEQALRVLKPGAWLLAFSGTRTYHRMVCGLEDAGFTIKDQLAWMYGSGFPKSLDISKAIDKTPHIKYVTEFKKWLNDQIKHSNKNQNQINEECGFTATSYGRYDANDGWAVNIPSKEKWKMMKKIIGFSNEYDWIIENNIEERGFLDEPTGGMHKGNGDSLRFEKEGKQLKDNPIDHFAKKWQGWQAALKPAFEPVILAQKPREGTYAENVLKWGVGGLYIDGCRIQYGNETDSRVGTDAEWNGKREASEHTVSLPAVEGMKMYKSKGRHPANVLLTHHPDCKLAGFKEVGTGKQKHNQEITRKGLGNHGAIFRENNSGFNVNKCQGLANYGVQTIPAYECHPDCPVRLLDEQSGESESIIRRPTGKKYDGVNTSFSIPQDITIRGHNDKGGASRFFYSGKAYKGERNAGLENLEHVENAEMVNRKEGSPGIENPRAGAGRGKGARNDIATLKPINLMRYLVRLICPKGGTVLDPFAGSGTTGIACIIEGMKYVLIEKRERFANLIIPKRLEYWSSPDHWTVLNDHNTLPELKLLKQKKQNADILSWT